MTRTLLRCLSGDGPPLLSRGRGEVGFFESWPGGCRWGLGLDMVHVSSISPASGVVGEILQLGGSQKTRWSFLPVT